MSGKPLRIVLDATHELAIDKVENIYTCTLFEYAPDNKRFIQIAGADGTMSLEIKEAIDSAASFQKILLWVGESSAIALFHGQKNFGERK